MNLHPDQSKEYSGYEGAGVPPYRSDGEMVLLVPYGQEQYLGRFFAGEGPRPEDREIGQDLIRSHIKNKSVLVVPGYSSNPFLFSELGASVVCGADIDLTTTAWMTLLRDHYKDRELGRLMMSMIDIPNIDEAASFRALFGRSPVSCDIYMMDSLKDLIRNPVPKNPIPDVFFIQASLGPNLRGVARITEVLLAHSFDLIYSPYLLGVTNGISEPEDIAAAFEDLQTLVKPDGIVMIAPFSGSPEESVRKYEPRRGLINYLSAFARQRFKVDEHKLYLRGNTATGILRPINYVID